MNGQTINVICFDVNGIFNPAETKMKSENVLLQETHLTPSEHEKLKRMGFSRMYNSPYKSGHREA